MRFEIENGDYVGSAEWQGPGNVALDMQDGKQREFFESYFASESAFMTGLGDDADMVCERRDSSEEAFNRSLFELAGHAYKVRAEGARRRARQKDGSS